MSTDATAQARAAMDAAETEARTVLQFPSNRVTGPLAGRDRRWAEDRLALIAADREQLTRHAGDHYCVGRTYWMCSIGRLCEDATTITRRWNGDNT